MKKRLPGTRFNRFLLSAANKSIFWYFDNNGVFHLIQMVGVLLLLRGLKIGLAVKK